MCLYHLVSSILGRSTNKCVSMSRVGCRIYIGNLSSSCREKDLERFFKGYGHLTDILIKQGYGFVEFEDYRDADDAVYDLDDQVLSIQIINGVMSIPLHY